VVEEDLLRVIEKVKNYSRMLRSFNSTFISLIPEKEKLELFDDSKPISLCNYIYKIMAKVIAIKVKGVLSKAISLE
jgi:hypothetical protein